MLDAIRAAKDAQSTEHLIQPLLRGEREALRVLLATRQGAVLASTAAINQFKALIISAPDNLRAELRQLKRPAQITHRAQIQGRPAQDLEHRMTARALHSTAQRAQSLQAEAKDLEKEILILSREVAPELRGLLGVGPITAAQILVSWSHQGRFRSVAAFASFAGVSPIPAPSGLTNQHRLNRSGDRQLNRAMHTITLIRMRLDPATKAYVARRITEEKTPRHAQRCLKRAICRSIFKTLERTDRAKTKTKTKTRSIEELVRAA
ncbi:transposase [Streptomyces sp. NPDC086010]|uniref:transposase n=1 Tax=Streptomyces sp. NPDC086010 TaxID=3365745 RepID=UPI0037D6FF9D